MGKVNKQLFICHPSPSAFWNTYAYFKTDCWSKKTHSSWLLESLLLQDNILDLGSLSIFLNSQHTYNQCKHIWSSWFCPMLITSLFQVLLKWCSVGHNGSRTDCWELGAASLVANTDLAIPTLQSEPSVWASMELGEYQPISPRHPLQYQEQPWAHFVQLREFCLVKRKRRWEEEGRKKKGKKGIK